MHHSTEEHHGLAKGALLMSIGFFWMAVFGTLLKETSSFSSLYFAVFISYIVALVIQFFVSIRKGSNFFKTKHIAFHFFRGFFGIVATYLYVIALEHILLMNATLLFNTTPLFVPIIATIFLKTKVSWKVWLSIVIGFIGVIFIIKPTTDIIRSPWDLIGLASGLSLAVAFIFVKILTRTEAPSLIIFYFFLVGAIVSSIVISFLWEAVPSMGWTFGISSGISFFITQIFVVAAYKVADMSSVGPFQYVSVIVAGFFDWLFWDRVPVLSDYIGTVLVIIGGVCVILLSKKTIPTVRSQ